MTHGDIKTKFLIEYDKMTTTSSYPSLTDYEILTILDKAYLAVVSNKFTGNNTRKVGFEGDNKAIEDIRALIQTDALNRVGPKDFNEVTYNIPPAMLFFIQGEQLVSPDTREMVQLVSNDIARKFKQTSTNVPWIPNPVIYIRGQKIHLLFDPYMHTLDDLKEFRCTYIKKPEKFVGNTDDTLFELPDHVAEEVINMAIIMSAEIVESPRLSTKASLNRFES